MRYLDASGRTLQAQFEEGLATLPPAGRSPPPSMHAPTEQPKEQAQGPRLPEVATPSAILRVTVSLARFSPQSRGLARARRLIEQTCFERYAMQRLNTEGTQYELTVPHESRDSLEEEIASLLDDMYRIAEDNQCLLEATFHEPATDSYWD